jgi:hypothetical protein
MNWRKTLRRSLKEVFSTAPREVDVETATPAQDGFQRFMDEWGKKLHIASRRSLSEK